MGSSLKKLLMVYSDLYCSCTKKAVFELSKALKPYYLISFVFYTDLNEEHFINNDIIYFQRLGANGGPITNSFKNKIYPLILKYRDLKYKKLIIYTIDDLILNRQENTPKEFISICDGVLVPNDSFDKYILPLNSNIIYGRTFVDLEEILAIQADFKIEGQPKFLWASTGALGINFANNLFLKILKKYPNGMIYFLGSSPKIIKHNRIKSLGILPYVLLIRFMKLCDILLNPIEDVTDDVKKKLNISLTKDFVSCKSEIKYVLAGATKIPIISSKSKSYDYAMTHEQTGILLDNDINLWMNYIDLLEKDYSFKQKIIQNAYNHILKEYTLPVTGQKHYTLFENLWNKKYSQKLETKPKALPFYLTYEEKDNLDAKILGHIFNKRIIIQEFLSTKSKLRQIKIKFATYNRDNNSVLKFSILNRFDIPIRVLEINTRDIKDNAWYSFNFDPIINSQNERYKIVLQGLTNKSAQAITAYYKQPNNVIGAKLFFGDSELKNSVLLFKLAYKEDE